MKSNMSAFQIAKKFMAFLKYMINCSFVLLLSTLLLVISCAKNDDLDNIENELPNVNDPIINELPNVNDPIIIIHTDVEPNYSSEKIGDAFNLDINNDLIIDFTLQSYKDSSNWIYLSIIGNNDNKIISVTPWYSNPVPLNSGKEIFNLASFTHGETYENWGFFTIGDCFGGEFSCYEDWKNKIDKYLGLKFVINGKTHYGWAQLNITGPTEWFVNDYAYNSTPNMPILAGQKD